jgi:DSF synthase
MSMYAYADVSSPGKRGVRAVPPAPMIMQRTQIDPRMIDLKVLDPKAAEPKIIDLKKNTDARRLYELEQLEVNFEKETGALWTFMKPRGRASYNPDLLEDFHAWQRGIVAAFENRPADIKYLLLGSRTPGIFNLGGDLNLFAERIRERDRAALVAYGESCVRILDRNMATLGLPMITIGLAQGDALGGGFESLLSFNIIIAEKQAKFGFPETMFGLFPGMGAYSLVSRRCGSAFAEEMMLSGKTYSADEMMEAGLVHLVVERGQGIEAAKDYMERNRRRHNGNRAVFLAGRAVNPVPLEEMDRVVQIWADACLQLSDRDLKVMQRLVAAQDRLNGMAKVEIQAAE